MIMSKGRKAYQIVINIILVLVALLMVLPLVLLFMSSITDENTLVVNGYSFFPAKFSLGAYQYIMQNSATIFRAYGITIIVTVVGTAGSLILASLMAFPLSLRDLPGRSILSFYVFFTMLFSGGLVPSYIMWTTTFHIKNTIWAYILPNFLLGAFNIILVRTFFSTSIPNDIYEAAKIDGAGYPTIYWKIVLPFGQAHPSDHRPVRGPVLLERLDQRPLLRQPVGYAEHSGAFEPDDTGHSGSGRPFHGRFRRVDADTAGIHTNGHSLCGDSAHSSGLSFPAEIFCQRYHAGRSQGLSGGSVALHPCRVDCDLPSLRWAKEFSPDHAFWKRLPDCVGRKQVRERLAALRNKK